MFTTDKRNLPVRYETMFKLTFITLGSQTALLRVTLVMDQHLTHLL